MRGYKEPDSGVIYIAFGEKYLEQAQYSAESLKKHTSIGITLLSDREAQSELFEEVKIIEPGHNRAKVDFLLQSPYDKTLYLDSDTLVLSDIGEIFSILERFDIVATHDLSRKRAEWTDLIPEYAEIPYGFPEINGGILGYRKTSAAKDLRNSWVK
jgi:lipopolysaccharide biosynthesis glycosyltransferase